MNLFKNEVGRPSNELIKKRKLFYAIIILAAVGIVTGTGLFISNYLKKSSIDALAKNAMSIKVIKKIYSSQPQATVSTKNKATVINGCPENYVHYTTNTCVKKATPIKQNISLTLTYTLKKNQSWNKAAPSKNTLEQFAKIKCNNKGYHYAKNVKYSFKSNVWEKRVYTVTATCSDLTSKYYKSSTKITVPYYNQKDYSSTYSACGGGNLSGKGCLPTSGAMIFSGLISSKVNKKLTPKDMNSAATKMDENKICDVYKGVPCYDIDFLKEYAKKGYTYKDTKTKKNKKITFDYKELTLDTYNKNKDEYDAYLKTGQCAGIAPLRENCSSGICVNHYHFVVFVANQEKNKITIKDPLYRDRANVKLEFYKLIESTQDKEGKVHLFCNKGIIKN